MKSALVVGCGLSGAVIARELAEKGYAVTIWEKRGHIGGNMYDSIDTHGILIHHYGPHTFHTKKKKLFDYICQYAQWDKYYLVCGAEINGICTPTPFNYQTIDDFYSRKKAGLIKEAIRKTFPRQKTATVLEALQCNNSIVREYAQFLFDNDYSLYTAKQWGCKPSEIDPSVLERVPLRFSYDTGYFDDEYQAMPHISYTDFFERLLGHPNIEVRLKHDALQVLQVENNTLLCRGKPVDFPVIYTGPLDDLFHGCCGKLPYRSLRFEWIYEDVESKQAMPVVAYPQENGFTRITEYKKLPTQAVRGTTYGIEYPIPYKSREENEPYYPLLTTESQQVYKKYVQLSQKVEYLYVCGRLGNFRYYNMDQALEAALQVAEHIE